MEYIRRRLWVGLLAVSLSGSALAENLSLPEGALSLSEHPQLSWDGVRFAASPRTKAAPPARASSPKEPGFWLKFSSGYDLVGMSDVGNSILSMTSFPFPGFTSQKKYSNGLISATAQLGVPLDTSLSLALECGGLFHPGLEGSLTDGSELYQMKMDSSVLVLSLDLNLDLSSGGGERTYLTLGGGLYLATIRYSSYIDYGSQFDYQADFSGSTFGGTLGVGHVFKLGGRVGLDLCVRGRVARVGKFSTTHLRSSMGNFPPESYSLTWLDVGPNFVTMLIPELDSDIDSDPFLTYSGLDLSGIDIMAGLIIYL